MRKTIRLFLGIIIFNILICITAFANEEMEWGESELLPEDVHYSVGYGQIGRGNYLSSSILNITNEGYGSIGILAGTYCHAPVKKIRMTVYLDCWNEIDQKWIQVDYYNFIYEHKEGEEDLITVTESFSVIGFPTGYHYRLRSFNCVWPFSGGSEMQGPMTDGVLITDGPVY